MSVTALARPQLRTAILDVALLTAVAFMPALAHALAFPLYQFEPMRIALFTALILSGRGNAAALAVVMPLLAFIISGHPVPPKLFFIQAELVANAWAFYWVLARAAGRPWRFAAAAAVSVITSKGAYYGLKYLALKAGLLDGALVTTSWSHQAAVLLLVVSVGQITWWARRK